MKAIEKVHEQYRSRIINLLNGVKARLEKAGFVCDEVDAGFSDTDYPYDLTAHHPERPEHKVHVELSIVDAEEYDGIKGHLNFEWKVQLEGGVTPYAFQPYNYTDECWVRAGDASAVENRFRAMVDVEVNQAVIAAAKKALRQRPKPVLHLWLHIGDGEPEDFGQDDSALADAIHEARIESQGIVWLEHGFKSSLGTHVAVYWGDAEGNVLQPLTKIERRDLEFRLLKLDVNRGRVFIVSPTTGGAAVGDKKHVVCLVDPDVSEDTQIIDVYGADDYWELKSYQSLAAAQRYAEKIGCADPEVI